MVSRRQVKDLLRGSSGENQTGGKYQDSSSQDGQVSTDGRRSPKLSTKGCKEEDTQKGKAQGKGTVGRSREPGRKAITPGPRERQTGDEEGDLGVRGE